MHPGKKPPHKMCKVGGKSFSIHIEFDEQLGESYPVYPDFEKNPEYTGDGRPFATAEQEGCQYCKPSVPEKALPGDCGGCSWFYRERTPYDPIGICMCDLRQRKNH